MCGIAGVIAFAGEGAPVDERELIKMRDTMVHRGPDGAGVWVGEGGRVGLAHRRLSIVDLSTAATQPMSNHDDTVWVVFNGEIYNHAEIRRRLEALGRRQWKTSHSDTEVLLQSFEEWGIDCLRQFRGMFAFAIWDSRTRELWLARDRVGEKPLYYSVHNGRLSFASEIKALLSVREGRRAVHEESLFHYLSFLASPAPQTLFDGILKLPCATYLRVRADGRTDAHRYWDPLDALDRPLTGSDDAISAELLDVLRTSVKMRAVADVPVGVFLSGGVDSSANAALFSQAIPGAVRTFSIGYRGENRSYPNELESARLVAQHVGAQHYERLLDVGDLLSFVPSMVRQQDEPIADPVCVPVYYVSQLARAHGVTVCQAGEGADELFCGYPGWRNAVAAESLVRLPLGRVGARTAAKSLLMVGRGDSLVTEWLRRGGAGQPIFWGGAEAFTDHEKRSVLSPRLRTRFKNVSSWEAIEPYWRRFQERSGSRPTIAWMTYLDLSFRLPELLLMRLDKMSMAASLETRSPFLDHELVELALRIPDRLKLHGTTMKYILKRSVKGLIPNSIINRRKQGFGIPMREWFFDRLGAEMHRELLQFCHETDLLDTAGVEDLVRRAQGAQLWYLYNLAMWWKTYIR